MASSAEAVHQGAATNALTRVSWVAAAWAFGYALYRGYYAIGGTAGMFGVPASVAEWRAINLVAFALLLGAAALPLIALPLWRHPWPRR